MTLVEIRAAGPYLVWNCLSASDKYDLPHFVYVDLSVIIPEFAKIIKLMDISPLISGSTYNFQSHLFSLFGFEWYFFKSWLAMNGNKNWIINAKRFWQWHVWK